jgi:hypothetical protein
MQRRSLGILALCVACGSTGRPGLSSDPAAVEFKTTWLGDSSEEAVVHFRNTGSESSQALQTALSGADPGIFSISADRCASVTLAPGATCEVRVVFRPIAEGDFAAALHVSAGLLAADVRLAGLGRSAVHLSLVPSDFSFGTVDLGRSATTDLTIRNDGDAATAPLAVSGGGDIASFMVDGSCAGRVLSPGQSCQVSIAFNPRSLDWQTLSLTVAGSPFARSTAKFAGGGRRLVKLTVTTEGDGQVSSPALHCSRGPCTTTIEAAARIETIMLAAIAGPKSLFLGWSGECTGATPSCELAMDADRTVVARFAPAVSVALEAASFAGGSGTVTVDEGTSCTAPCRASVVVRRGSRIRLSVSPDRASQVRWTAGCSGSELFCEWTASDDLSVTAVFNGANYVFVTSQAYPTNLGLPAYDAICNAHASAAGLPGPYAAWLSTKATPAWSRFTGARGFIRVDGRPFADTLAPGAPVYFPPSLDEFGHLRNKFVRLAMTGTDNYGNTDAQANCSDWTVAGNVPLKLGDPMTGTATWTGWAGSACVVPWLLYCIGTGLDRPLQLERSAGRIAFVSYEAFPAGGGIGAADSLCGREARDAGLGGSFKALLAVTGASATGRFDLHGPRWVRPDGVPVVEKASDLAGGNLLAPIDQYASGAYDLQFNFVWAGARSQSQAGTDGDTCSSWTSAASTLRSTAASDVTTEANWFGGGDIPCQYWGRVICLQE